MCKRSSNSGLAVMLFEFHADVANIHEQESQQNQQLNWSCQLLLDLFLMNVCDGYVEQLTIVQYHFVSVQCPFTRITFRFNWCRCTNSSSVKYAKHSDLKMRL